MAEAGFYVMIGRKRFWRFEAPIDAESAEKLREPLIRLLRASRSELGSEGMSDPVRYDVKVVEGEEELVTLLGEGWDLVKELNNSRFVVRRTSR